MKQFEILLVSTFAFVVLCLAMLSVLAVLSPIGLIAYLINNYSDWFIILFMPLFILYFWLIDLLECQ